MSVACIPESDAPRATAASGAPDLWLLLCSPAPESIENAADVARRLDASFAKEGVAPPIGLTIHDARSIDQARAAFDAVADATDGRLARPVRSYGLIADDLHLYRAIVAQRPIGLAHPQSPAARALADVARLLIEDLTGGRDD